MDLEKALSAIIIIRVDDQKRLMHQPFHGKNCLTGSPGFLSSFGYMIALGQRVQFLKRILHIGNFLDAVSNDLPEVLLQIFTDNEDNLVESGRQRVMNGIIHDNLTARAYRRQLLDATAKPAPDSCRHND